MTAPTTHAAAPTGGHAGRVGPEQTVPRLALSVSEACEALGVGWDFFSEHVASELRIVRRGRRKLIPVGELTAWLERNAELTLPDTGIAAPTSDEIPANRGVRASRAPGRRAA